MRLSAALGILCTSFRHRRPLAGGERSDVAGHRCRSEWPRRRRGGAAAEHAGALYQNPALLADLPLVELGRSASPRAMR